MNGSRRTGHAHEVAPGIRRRRLVLRSAAWAAWAAGGAAAWAGGTMPRTAVAATVGCATIAGPARLRFIGNSFPAIQHLARVAQVCSGPGVDVAFKLTPQARSETETAFASAAPSPYDAAVVSMGVFSTLLSRGQLHPLTALVEKYAARYRLEEPMLVRIDGQVMALAFMQNTQNLFYRQDLFERHRIAVPTTYAQMLEAAALLRAGEPAVAFPITQGFAKGFDLATEFANLHVSLGGHFFEPGRTRPAFHGEAGAATVALMRELLPHMTPNALASNADDVMNQLQQGRAAMGVLWASRASRLDDPQASKVVGRIGVAAAPAARAGGPSAAHLWWDGVVMPRRAGPAREAAFHVLMEMLSEDAVRAGNELAIWVRSAYRPGRHGTGVALARAAGAPVWPGEPFFSLAHAELGKALPDALKGERPVREVLHGAAAAYAKVAAEKGFIAS